MAHLIVKDLGSLKKFIRVRFAPSPTGDMHLGNMRTAIFNYLFAKSLGGKFLLRIEDTDFQRSKKEYEESILKYLGLMGITYDEEIVYQSKNLQYHQEVAHQLFHKNMAYYCQCSSKDGEENQFHIICNCKEKNLTQGALRFKIEHDSLTFDDFVMGTCQVKGDHVQDFIILRTDGTPTYNLSVVCDDHTMDISHIIRGNDHLSNTFKQIAIYKAMGWDVPLTAHLPLIVNMEGKKLSKRDGDISIKNYINNGFLPETLLSFLIRLGWSYGDQEIFTMEELLKIFPQGKMQKSSAAYNESKLLFQNKYFLSQKPWNQAKDFIFNYLNIQGVNDLNMAVEGFDLIKSRCNTLMQIAESLKTYIPELFDGIYTNVDWDKKSLSSLVLLKNYFSSKEFNSMDHYNQLNNYMKENGFEPKEYQQLLRYILTKEKVGPHLVEVIKVVSIYNVINRINNFLLIIL
jgi:glutamyl-tRNA synthetase